MNARILNTLSLLTVGALATVSIAAQAADCGVTGLVNEGSAFYDHTLNQFRVNASRSVNNWQVILEKTISGPVVDNQGKVLEPNASFDLVFVMTDTAETCSGSYIWIRASDYTSL